MSQTSDHFCESGLEYRKTDSSCTDRFDANDPSAWRLSVRGRTSVEVALLSVITKVEWDQSSAVSFESRNLIHHRYRNRVGRSRCWTEFGLAAVEEIASPSNEAPINPQSLRSIRLDQKKATKSA